MSKKVLNKSVDRNRLLAASLISNAEKVGQQSGLPFFTITEKDQHGNTFGERLANAIAETFDRGYEKVIVIGNDCPALTHQIIQQAAKQLGSQKLVIGPTPKGGAYLIGVTSAGFDKSGLENIVWKTSSVITELNVWAKNNFPSTLFLPTLSDLNTEADFIALAQRYGGLHNWLRSLLMQPTHELLHHFQRRYLSQGPISVTSHRGPPVLPSAIVFTH